MNDIEDLKVYQLAYSYEKRIWDLVMSWSYFEKSTIGRQLVRSADSVSANICEGYGRYHYKENKNFLFYARGSLYETKNWLKKASDRGLIDHEVYKKLESDSVVIVKCSMHIFAQLARRQMIS